MTTSPAMDVGRQRPYVPLLLAVLAIPAASTVALLAATSGIGAEPDLGLSDPGPVTAWGLPSSRAIRVAAVSVTLGALVVAAAMVAPKDRDRLSKAQARLAALATVAATTWLWAAVVEFILTFSDIAGREPQALSVTQLWFFATDIEVGKILGWNVLLAVAVVFTALASRTITGLALGALITIAGLWAVALTGHAASDANHDLAVNAQFLHLAAIGLWMGCLVALIWIRRLPDVDLATIAGRHSQMAAWCYAAVAISGLAGAVLRVPSVNDLASTYGALLAIKVALFATLGALGWWQRRTQLVRMRQNDGTGRSNAARFVRIVLAEIALMAVTAGAGSALSRTPPPQSAEATAPTTGEAILGRPLPPPLGLTEWFTQWRVDSFWGLGAILLAVSYFVGVRRLNRRGDHWSRGRTAAWIIGCAGLFWATSGAPGAYGDVLFSMHMVQHMTIATAVPTLLVLGAPVTLALRALRPRADGSYGAREWLLATVHSLPGHLLAQPIVATTLFVVGMFAFYYSSLFEQSLRGHTMHLLMTAHFLVTGYLFANVVCGVDPGPRRPLYPIRILLIMVAFGFHAFFSIALMGSQTLLAGDWFTSLDRTWGRSPADDQHLGAALGWGLGEYPLVMLAGALLWSWFRDDQREARRLDRQADRDDDQALHEYNQYLRSLGDADRDRRNPR